MSKEQEFVNKLVKHIIAQGNKDFGFCGLADCGNQKILNTGDDRNIIIKIELGE